MAIYYIYQKITIHKVHPVHEDELAHPLWRKPGILCLRSKNSEATLWAMEWASKEYKDYRVYELINSSCIERILPKLVFDKYGYAAWPEDLMI